MFESSSTRYRSVECPHHPDAEIENYRILVFGNPGVGKTSFVHLLVSQKKLLDPTPTSACSIEVLAHQRGNALCTVELWEIGANPRFKVTRRTFYRCIHRQALQCLEERPDPDSETLVSMHNRSLEDTYRTSPSPVLGIHGIIFVYDISNRNSYACLQSWIHEVMEENNIMDYTWDGRDVTFGDQKGRISVLIVGTKKDLVKQLNYEDEGEKGIDVIYVCTRDEGELEHNGFLYSRISAFIDRCILNSRDSD